MRITSDDEKRIMIKILKALKVPEEHAKIVADVTLDADLKGFSSHGIGRFPQYVKGIKHGNIKTKGKIEIEKETSSTALINGNHLLGHFVTYKGTEIAIKKAKRTGVGLVGIHDSNHFGIAGYYSDMAIKEDMIGIVMANTEPAVAPLGGKEPILGTNPIAISIPSNKYYVSVDMATSASARGKLLEAARKGENIPEGIALDSDGNPTTDPKKALEGSILPFGGHKGYALSLMVEILAGPLVKAAIGREVKGTVNPYEKCTKGDLILAINPSNFVNIKEFKEQVDKFVEEVKSTGKVLIPGDIEKMNMKKNLEEGIYIDKELLEEFKKIEKELNLDLNLEG